MFFINIVRKEHTTPVIDHILANRAAFRQVFKTPKDLITFVKAFSITQAEKVRHRLFNSRKEDSKQIPTIEEMFTERVFEKNDSLVTPIDTSRLEHLDRVILYVRNTPDARHLLPTKGNQEKFETTFREDIERALKNTPEAEHGSTSQPSDSQDSSSSSNSNKR